MGGPGQQSDLKEAARQAFLRQIHEHRRNTDDKIIQLQDQIRSLQAEHNRVEDKLMKDMDQCLRYIWLICYNTNLSHRIEHGNFIFGMSMHI